MSSCLPLLPASNALQCLSSVTTTIDYGITRALTLLNIIDSNNTKEDEEEERGGGGGGWSQLPEEEGWSQLPDVLLWMIKDRLAYVDDFRLSLVCKNWNLASKNDPSEPRHNLGTWLMTRCPDSTTCEFINLSTMEKLYLDLPGIRTDAKVVYSRRGWLLLRESHTTWLHGKHSTLTLLNVHTNSTRELPEINIHLAERNVPSFSSFEDGTPHYIFFTEIAPDDGLTLYITQVGDKELAKYSYTVRRLMGYVRLIILGYKICCLDAFGGTLIFDVSTHEWTEVEFPLKLCDTMWLVDSDEKGKIVKLEVGRHEEHFWFFKLNDSLTGWERLSLNKVSEGSWYLHMRCMKNCLAFNRTEGTKKVFELAIDIRKVDNTMKSDFVSIVRVHD